MEAELGEANRTTSRLVTSAEKAAERAQELRAEAEVAAKAVARLEAKLKEQLGAIVMGKEGAPIETCVLEAVAAESELRECFDRACAERDQALRKRTRFERSRDKADAALKNVEEELESLAAPAQEHRDEIERLNVDP